MNIQENYPLQQHNSLSLKQQARYFVEANTVAELQEALHFYTARFSQEPKPGYMVLGSGSNVVFSRDYPGLIIKNAIKGLHVIHADNNHVDIEVGAGENWHDLVCSALQNHWYGLENLALIPGTVGAAPVQNIGAYGVELKDIFISAQVYDTKMVQSGNSKLRTLDKDACAFAYRDSVFKHEPGRYIITQVCLRLATSSAVNISYQALQNYFANKQLKAVSPHDVFDAVIAIRSSRLPDPAVLPNAGSFFKNPVISVEHYQTLLQQYPQLAAYPVEDKHKMKLAAAWLIDQAGWKGVQKGNVAVHDQQALVLVNRGGATGQELLSFAEEICRDVKRRYKVDLEIEPTIV